MRFAKLCALASLHMGVSKKGLTSALIYQLACSMTSQGASISIQEPDRCTQMILLLAEQCCMAADCKAWSLESDTKNCHESMPSTSCAGGCARRTPSRQEVAGASVCVCLCVGLWWLHAGGQGVRLPHPVFQKWWISEYKNVQFPEKVCQMADVSCSTPM